MHGLMHGFHVVTATNHLPRVMKGETIKVTAEKMPVKERGKHLSFSTCMGLSPIDLISSLKKGFNNAIILAYAASRVPNDVTYNSNQRILNLL